MCFSVCVEPCWLALYEGRNVIAAQPVQGKLRHHKRLHSVVTIVTWEVPRLKYGRGTSTIVVRQRENTQLSYGLGCRTGKRILIVKI